MGAEEGAVEKFLRKPRSPWWALCAWVLTLSSSARPMGSHTPGGNSADAVFKERGIRGRSKPLCLTQSADESRARRLLFSWTWYIVRVVETQTIRRTCRNEYFGPGLSGGPTCPRH
jgi:hypothetical protein